MSFPSLKTDHTQASQLWFKWILAVQIFFFTIEPAIGPNVTRTFIGLSSRGVTLSKDLLLVILFLFFLLFEFLRVPKSCLRVREVIRSKKKIHLLRVSNTEIAGRFPEKKLWNKIGKLLPTWVQIMAVQNLFLTIEPLSHIQLGPNNATWTFIVYLNRYLLRESLTRGKDRTPGPTGMMGLWLGGLVKFFF